MLKQPQHESQRTLLSTKLGAEAMSRHKCLKSVRELTRIRTLFVFAAKTVPDMAHAPAK